MNSALALDAQARAEGASAAAGAWVVISNAHEASGIAQAVQAAGWQLRGVAHGMAGMRELLHS